MNRYKLHKPKPLRVFGPGLYQGRIMHKKKRDPISMDGILTGQWPNTIKLVGMAIEDCDGDIYKGDIECEVLDFSPTARSADTMASIQYFQPHQLKNYE